VKTINLLLCDPAFRNFGWAVLRVHPIDKGELVITAGCIRTEKAERKQKLLAADDNHRCVGEIINTLRDVHAEHTPFLICAESQQGSKNSHAMQLQGMAWGALSAFSYLVRTPILQVSPQTVKKTVCGRRDASKEEIRDKVLERWPGSTSDAIRRIKPASLHEHIYDALAVGIVCLQSETIQMVRKMNAA
jgi:Holliday junction resolvasome RuvABC endonuclease subunit